jgi:hypothetical protein
MLTFELNTNHDELTIHADAEGLRELQQQVAFLLSGSSGHVHLMTPSWGGSELSEEHQVENSSLLNKVTIFRWQNTST